MLGNVIFKYIDEVTTLDVLQKTLPDALLFETLQRILSVTQTSELSRTPCPVHGKLPQVIVEIDEHDTIDVRAISCCPMMEEKVTGPLRSTLRATAYFQPGMTLSLQVMDDYSDPYIFNAHQIEKLVIGRYNTDDKSQLDLDLTDHVASSRGVSRRHAWIIWKAGALHIVDNASVNGTFLNGKRLDPFTPYKIHNKDVIRLSKLNLEIKVTEN